MNKRSEAVSELRDIPPPETTTKPPLSTTRTRPRASASPDNRDVRASLLVFPACTQGFWTWLTGKPLPNQKRSRATPWSYLFVTLACLTLGVIVSACCLTAMTRAAFWTLPVLGFLLAYSLLLTAGSARVLHIVCAHHCLHRAFTGSLAGDRAVTEFIGLLIFMLPWDSFVEEHIGVHHSKKLATLEDSDVKMLLTLGFRPGMTRRKLWRKLAMTLFSPRFHWMFFKARLQWNFTAKATPLWRKAAAFLLHGGTLAGVIAACFACRTALPFWIYVMAWVAPLGPGFAISALAQWCTEHKWLRMEMQDPKAPYRVLLTRLTNGRFVGDAVPLSCRDIGFFPWLQAWGIWSARLVCVHIPVRIYLWVGDLVAHDFHHRKARDRDWPNAIYSREAAVAHPAPGDEPWTEVWNFQEAANSIFDVLEGLPAMTVSAGRLTQGESDAVFQGM